MVAKGVILPESHVPMWRAEQVRVDNFVYPSGVGQIIRIGIFKAADVVESMVADAVSVFYHHPVFVRCLRILSPTMKKVALISCFFSSSSTQGVTSGDRAVVKSQVDCPFVWVHPEDGLWIQRSEEPRWLFYKHKSLY